MSKDLKVYALLEDNKKDIYAYILTNAPLPTVHMVWEDGNKQDANYSIWDVRHELEKLGYKCIANPDRTQDFKEYERQGEELENAPRIPTGWPYDDCKA